MLLRLFEICRICIYCRGLTACAADPMMFIHDDDENLLIFRITKMGEVELRKAK